jgi:hypothetical protein
MDKGQGPGGHLDIDLSGGHVVNDVPTTIISVSVVGDELHVVSKQTSMALFAVYNDASACPDVVWKDVYAVKDGRIVLARTIRGRHTPSQNIPETIEFPEDD